MTARIMVDLARLAYNKEPEFECNEKIGDEDAIRELVAKRQMDEITRKPKPDRDLEPEEARSDEVKEKSNI
jgi:hypothetical protein